METKFHNFKKFFPAFFSRSAWKITMYLSPHFLGMLLLPYPFLFGVDLFWLGDEEYDEVDEVEEGESYMGEILYKMQMLQF